MKILGNEIKPGMILNHDNDQWEVIKTQHVKPGKGGAFNQVELKSINKDTKRNERFRSGDKVQRVVLEEKKFNFLFEDDNDCHFMDRTTFEQIAVSKKKINMPTVAIGGINDSNYKKILSNGADFVACSNYIWNNKKLDPVSAIKKFK